MTRLSIWWKARSELVQKLSALAGSYASVAGLLVPFLPSPRELPLWAVILLVSTTIFFVAVIVLEFRGYRSRRAYARTDVAGIRAYMQAKRHSSAPSARRTR